VPAGTATQKLSPVINGSGEPEADLPWRRFRVLEDGLEFMTATYTLGYC
jgi:hypothetical protein